MPKKRFGTEQIVTLLRQIEASMAQGKSAPEACRDAGISQQSYAMSCSTVKSSTA
jgi:putative transposase